MLDPAAARNTFADDLVAEYQRLELILLELIADKIARGLDAPDWAARQVMELQRFRREAGVIAAKMAGKSPELIASAIQRAVTDGFLAASQDIAIAEGISAGQVVANAGTVPAIDGPAIAALLAETTGALTAVDQGVLRVTDDIYRKVVARGAATVVAGAETRKLATQRALNEFTRNGITGFLDRRGKSWSLTAYTEMAIRTGTTKALMQSHSDRLTERGYDLVIVSSHPRPAPQCQPYERQILSLSGRTLGVISETSRTTGRTVSVKVKASLAEAESRGLHHPNAILGGDQGIDTMGRIFNGVRAWYSGPSVNVTCASGVRFTVSPNHPVLTSLGWMPAKALDVGHHLFRTTGADLGGGTTVAGEYLDDMPPLVEEVFDALASTGSSSRVPAAANDLHNDGRFCQGEIDVVVADDRLLLVGDANGVQCGGESHLVGADVKMPGRPSAGALGLDSDTVGGSIRGALPHFDSDFMQSAEDRAVADSEDVGEVLRGLPRLVETDQIVDVERDAFYEGHAYDFQTGTGAYALNSLIVHNCRHRHSLFVPGVTDTSPTKADDEGYEDTQKLRYMERQTREWKRRAATSLDPVEKKVAQAKVREWQGKIKAHTETTGVGRRRDREQLDAGIKAPTLDVAPKSPKVVKPKPAPKAEAIPLDVEYSPKLSALAKASVERQTNAIPAAARASIQRAGTKVVVARNTGETSLAAQYAGRLTADGRKLETESFYNPAANRVFINANDMQGSVNVIAHELAHSLDLNHLKGRPARVEVQNPGEAPFTHTVSELASDPYLIWAHKLVRDSKAGNPYFKQGSAGNPQSGRREWIAESYAAVVEGRDDVLRTVSGGSIEAADVIRWSFGRLGVL